MTQQFLNFPEKVRTVLFNNWALDDELKKEHFLFASYKISDKIRMEKSKVIEITDQSALANPETRSLTQMKNLLKVSVYLKLTERDNTPDKRTSLDNDRAVIVNHIMDLVATNKFSINGVKIAQFGKIQNADSVEDGQMFLNSSVFITCEWYHARS